MTNSIVIAPVSEFLYLIDYLQEVSIGDICTQDLSSSIFLHHLTLLLNNLTQTCGNLQKLNDFNILLQKETVVCMTNVHRNAKRNFIRQMRHVKCCTCRVDTSRKLLHTCRLETNIELGCEKPKSCHICQRSFFLGSHLKKIYENLSWKEILHM